AYSVMLGLTASVAYAEPTNQPTNQNSNASEQLEQINVLGNADTTINIKEKKVGETQISAKKLSKQQASDS
ncbi:hypothetical protein CH580_009620, partial [Haemophilus influenzae]|nr:hypothetical protein [Haemophilus influenzae]